MEVKKRARLTRFTSYWVTPLQSWEGNILSYTHNSKVWVKMRYCFYPF